jgi:hypothetical protein
MIKNCLISEINIVPFLIRRFLQIKNNLSNHFWEIFLKLKTLVFNLFMIFNSVKIIKVFERSSNAKNNSIDYLFNWYTNILKLTWGIITINSIEYPLKLSSVRFLRHYYHRKWNKVSSFRYLNIDDFLNLILNSFCFI